MADAPGPYAVRDPMPLAPRVVTPHLFEGLGAELVGVLGGVDGGLAAVTATLAPVVGQDVDPAFGADLGAAVDGLTGLGLLGDAVDYANVLGAGNAIDGATDAQQRDLPGPDETEPPSEDQGFEHEPGPSDEPEPGGPPPI